HYPHGRALCRAAGLAYRGTGITAGPAGRAVFPYRPPAHGPASLAFRPAAAAAGGGYRSAGPVPVTHPAALAVGESVAGRGAGYAGVARYPAVAGGDSPAGGLAVALVRLSAWQPFGRV